MAFSSRFCRSSGRPNPRLSWLMVALTSGKPCSSREHGGRQILRLSGSVWSKPRLLLRWGLGTRAASKMGVVCGGMCPLSDNSETTRSDRGHMLAD